jgi:transcriptional repressor NrdR
MQCPFCKNMESRVIDSRLAAGGTVTWRRRECDGCSRRFTTYERVEHTLPTVVKKDGQREPFNRAKILHSLQIACSKRPVTTDQLEQAAEALEQELAEYGEKEVSTLVIGERVMSRLKQLDEVAYVRFASVYKSFRDIDEFMREVGNLIGPRGD